MRLYNSLTKKIDEFKPLRSDSITIYSCGPTVYDHLHIGNLRAFVVADTLRRAINLDVSAAKIKHVMNITDVDDKTIRRSREEHPNLDPSEALAKLTKHYEKVFINDMQRISNDTDFLTLTRATDAANIKAMQDLIGQLYDDGVAYLADDGIYFSIEKYQQRNKKYGQLSEVSASNTSRARIANDEYDKDSVHDFALWKAQKDNEPAWDFEIGGKEIKGRPGWHIECSAMSQRLLGTPFDIHTAGVDLKFPHNENEIAQSTALSREDTFAHFFVHNEHILVDGQKMAKSLGNFITLDEIVKRGYDPLALRLLFLQAHYRSQMNFTWNSLSAAQAFLKRLQAWADLKLQPYLGHKDQTGDAYSQALDEIVNDIKNDLDTSQALAELSSLVALSEQEGIDPLKLQTLLEAVDKLFSLKLSERQDIDDSLKSLISDREKARKNKDWEGADKLRQQLADLGIEINDTPHGPVWSRA